MGWIRAVDGETAIHQDVCDPLHTLPRHAHPPADVGDGPRLIEDAAEHLPRRGCDLSLGRQVLGDVHQAPIEAERGQDDVGEGGARSALWVGLRPSISGRSSTARRPAHDAAAMSVGYADASSPWKTAS
jgi:hypothetical protein